MSVTASMALHAGGFLLFMHMSQTAAKTQSVKIDDVDFIRVFKTAPAPQQKAPPPTLTQFLKMALPEVRKPQLQAAAPKLPDIRRPLLPAAPKLEDRGRLQQPAKMEALSLDKRRVDAARIDAKLQERRTAALAALPRLEDVGRRQVRNLPAALKLEEQRQEAVVLKAIGSMPVAPARRGLAPAAVLQEATPQQSSRLGRAITEFLPAASEPVRLQPRAAEPPPQIRKIETAPPAAPKRTADIQVEKKRAVELEGPLADRQVVSYDVPQFPDWAKARNIIEAEVVILFYVDPEGGVLSDMRVERTSGYGGLDRLSMDSLRRWRFAPIAASERQWGRITFRFILE
jgi:TonB family protein